MEAMWMRFNPLIQRIARDERFGEIREVRAAFGFHQPYDPAHRLWDPALGGGALLDLGVYPFALAQLLLGTPLDMQVTGSLGPSGVDAEASVQLAYPGDARAMLETSLLKPLSNTATVIGSGMTAEIDASFWAPRRIVLTRPGAEPEELHLEAGEDGYRGEVREVAGAVAEGRTESSIMPLDDTLAVMRRLEEARRRLGAR
ncbi:Gfo/Idh/MocA family oxidoreductase [Nonomuraea typhae]|uniref:Gfo/Idh/MocA family oxidoreductase n=1 Tax=Nonomuraea typhae TaxID=2603600 RepID=A0ABW7YJU7_9ACTN